MPAWKKPFFANGSAASSMNAEVVNLEQKKKQISLISIQKYLRKYVAVLKNIYFEINGIVLKTKTIFLVKKILKNVL